VSTTRAGTSKTSLSSSSQVSDPTALLLLPPNLQGTLHWCSIQLSNQRVSSHPMPLLLVISLFAVIQPSSLGNQAISQPSAGGDDSDTNSVILQLQIPYVRSEGHFYTGHHPLSFHTVASNRRFQLLNDFLPELTSDLSQAMWRSKMSYIPSNGA
jgi:hypothetical protein